MAGTVEDVGILLVHGMGEQKKLEYLRSSARELASFIAADEELIRVNVIDDSAREARISIDAVFRRDQGEERIRLHLHEAWWADLGTNAGLLEHVKFWLWGLGQWAAQIVTSGNPSRNTVKLMALPRFPRSREAGGAADRPQPALSELPSRLLLIGAALLAVLTFFTWSALKRVIAFFSQRLPEPSLIFMFLGDVKTFERPGGPGKGTLQDPNMPVRATIRRRVIGEMVAMAQRPYDRWFLFAHSLGTVPAFNAVQETELALPNYLSEAEWTALAPELKTTSPFAPPRHEPQPSTSYMMPRRPPWLGDRDGIDRTALFARFGGLLTFGSPLDKFAALWPRTVPLNRQADVFPRTSEWVNLYDPTDPVASRLDAFGRPETALPSGARERIFLEPRNFACRASRVFGLSHIRYFTPRPPGPKTMPALVAKALTSRGRTTLAEAAAAAQLGMLRRAVRRTFGFVQLALIGAALVVAAGALLAAIGKLLPAWIFAYVKEALEAIAPGLLPLIGTGGTVAVLAAAALAMALALLAILASGIARLWADRRVDLAGLALFVAGVAAALLVVLR